MAEFYNRTEPPTERRRREARQQGRVARSPDLVAAGGTLAAALLIGGFGISLLRSLAELTRASLQGAGAVPPDSADVVHQFRDLGQFLALNVLPIMLLMAAAVLVFNLIQVGFLLVPGLLQPQFARLNPFEGVKRILSGRSLRNLGMSLVKVAFLVALAAWTISGRLTSFLQFSEQQPANVLLAIHDSAVSLGFQLAAALMALALLDFGLQRWKHERDLRMTKQEVRDEAKQLQGDPLIRQRVQKNHRTLGTAGVEDARLANQSPSPTEAHHHFMKPQQK